MKRLAWIVLVGLAASVFLTGCETMGHRAIPKEKDDVSVLGGLYSKKKGAFEKLGPTEFGEKSSKLGRKKDFDGDRVSFLWGLITIVDE